MLLDIGPIFTSTGSILQVEYAKKAVANGTTCIALRYKDGILFMSENPIESKLIKPKQRIKKLSSNSMIVYTGVLNDGFCIYKEVNGQIKKQVKSLDAPISSGFLENVLNRCVGIFSRYLSCRPVGCNFLASIYDGDLRLYNVECNGNVREFKASAIGKGSQRAKTELEKLDFDFDLETAVDNAVKIMYLCHDNLKDKEFVIQARYIDVEGKGEMKDVDPEMLNRFVDMHNSLSVDF